MSADNKIDYIEFPAKNIEENKRFYSAVFGWPFTDYGPSYTSFEDGRIAGGFTTDRTTASSGVLVVLYSSDLAQLQHKIETAGGKIVKETFEFPGGRRFHFTDPSGNELAVWSDK